MQQHTGSSRVLRVPRVGCHRGRNGGIGYGLHLTGVTSSGFPFLELIQPAAVRRQGHCRVYGARRPSVTCKAMSTSNGVFSIGFQPRSRGDRITLFPVSYGPGVSAASNVNPRQTLELALLCVMHPVQLWRRSNGAWHGEVVQPDKRIRIHPASRGGKDVFVHISAVEKAGLSSLNEGQGIEYEEVSNRGKTSAENLKVQR
jgi:cold shock protein